MGIFASHIVDLFLEDFPADAVHEELILGSLSVWHTTSFLPQSLRRIWHIVADNDTVCVQAWKTLTSALCVRFVV